MRLVNVLEEPIAAAVLFKLLQQRPRENRVSHVCMPTFAEHEKFVHSHPFRYWYLIAIAGKAYVGAIEVTDLNEIGIAVFADHQRKGIADQALRLFMDTHQPLPPVPAVRNGRWLANIAVGNGGSKAFFWNAGFRPLQETWAL